MKENPIKNYQDKFVDYILENPIINFDWYRYIESYEEVNIKFRNYFREKLDIKSPYINSMEDYDKSRTEELSNIYEVTEFKYIRSDNIYDDSIGLLSSICDINGLLSYRLSVYIFLVSSSLIPSYVYNLSEKSISDIITRSIVIFRNKLRELNKLIIYDQNDVLNKYINNDLNKYKESDKKMYRSSIEYTDYIINRYSEEELTGQKNSEISGNNRLFLKLLKKYV